MQWETEISNSALESISGRNAMMYVISTKNSNNFDIT